MIFFPKCLIVVIMRKHEIKTSSGISYKQNGILYEDMKSKIEEPLQTRGDSDRQQNKLWDPRMDHETERGINGKIRNLNRIYLLYLTILCQC